MVRIILFYSLMIFTLVYITHAAENALASIMKSEVAVAGMKQSIIIFPKTPKPTSDDDDTKDDGKKDDGRKKGDRKHKWN
ncbi:hypothetical protein AKO1_015641 [Acrasis kona]|uniref:Uncharacterized protein n=1 Tax=Acrasis kona TaxID=1008807 RepID=A0AAW2ZGI2_9EUKA